MTRKTIKKEYRPESCKHCGSVRFVKCGLVYVGHKKQRWVCKDCGRLFYTDFKEGKP